MPQIELLLARQPILDATLRLKGYELLARDAGGRFPENQPGYVSTCQVLTNALADFGLEDVVGGLPAWINLTREFLTGEIPLPLPPERVVLELLESIEPDVEVVRGLQRLKQAGFALAVDDYVGPRPGYHEILSLADFVKVDCLGRTPAEITRIVRGLRPYGVRLLAEKLERHEEFREVERLGFELFQGYFFARPDLLKAREQAADRTTLLRLMARLQDPETTPDELEVLIAQDPALSLKLLRFLNSAQIGLNRQVESLREVVLYLGAETVRNIACLLMFSRVDGKPQQLVVTAMMRARMCEQLARSSGSGRPQRSFTVGLFSTLDALVDRDLSEVVQSLPLHEEISRALLARSGVLGEQLQNVLAFERGEFDSLPERDPTPSEVQSAYLEAAGWVARMQKELAATN